MLDKRLRQVDLRFIMVVVRHVHQPLRLFLERDDHPRVAVAQIAHGHAGDEVDVFPAVGVEDPGPPALDEHDRLPAVGVHDVCMGIREDVAGDHEWESNITCLKNQTEIRACVKPEFFSPRTPVPLAAVRDRFLS